MVILAMLNPHIQWAFNMEVELNGMEVDGDLLLSETSIQVVISKLQFKFAIYMTDSGT